MKKISFILAAILFTGTSIFAGDKTYWFCVTSPTHGSYKVKASYVGVDLGREAARAMVLNEVRPLMGSESITINEYNPNTCPCGPTCEELSVIGKNIDGEIVQNFLEGGFSSLPGSVVEITDVLIYETKEIVHKPSNIVEKPVKEVKRFFKKVF